jgi:DNA-directed RNA polymerase specialized sigma24 family protein
MPERVEIRWEDVPQVLEEVKSIARRLLSMEISHSLRPTGLVLTALRRQRRGNETWEEVRWQDREHFLRSMYVAMQHALVDHARVRMRRRVKPEGSFLPEELRLDDLCSALQESSDQVDALAIVLERWKSQKPDWVELIHHRIFGGYTFSEVARMQGVDEKTVRRRWRAIRTLLAREVLEALNR